jgi:hypothetical protein
VSLICALLALSNTAKADTLTKLSEVKSGEITKLSIAGLDFGRSALFVIAGIDNEGLLSVQVWGFEGERRPRLVKPAGKIKEVATVSVSGERWVTAVRDNDDNLRVIAWRISDNGLMIKRLGTAVGPRISKLAAASGAGDTVFIAARQLDGRLFVGYFEVVGNAVNPKKSETYSEVSTIAASSGTTNTAVMRDGEGKLRLIHFWNPLFRGGIGTGLGISDVRITNNSDGFSGEWFTFSIDEGPTGVRTGAGCTQRLLIGHGLGKLIGWKLENTSLQSNFKRTREKQLTDFGGIAKVADLVFLDSTPRARLVTAHLGFDNFCRLLPEDRGKPRLQLTVWDTRSREDEFVKTAEAHLGGDYTEIGITEVTYPTQQRFVVALRGVRGELKVTHWRLN